MLLYEIQIWVSVKKANLKAGQIWDLHQMYIGVYQSQYTFCALVPLEGTPQMHMSGPLG